MRMRVTHLFEIRLKTGIIRTVTEAYESHRNIRNAESQFYKFCIMFQLTILTFFRAYNNI